MMTNAEMLKIAMEQSAEDIGCKAEDFLSGRNAAVPFRPGVKAKKCYKMPISCNFISYGNNVVAGTSEELSREVEEYLSKFEFYHCFEVPNMQWLNDRLAPKGQAVCLMAEYFLPDLNKLKNFPCGYELRILEQADFEGLYLPEWSNALCRERKELDILGIGAFDNGKMAGFAACSADAEEMWQIGVDVLPDYRRKGIASSVTSRLALEILDRGKVPFYCSAWSNIRSVRNAVKSGFVPSWVEMTVKPKSIVDQMNSEGHGEPDLL